MHGCLNQKVMPFKGSRPVPPNTLHAWRDKGHTGGHWTFCLFEWGCMRLSERVYGAVQPDCPGWEKDNQCVANPTMMLGATDLGPGCRKSCRRCHADASIQVCTCLIALIATLTSLFWGSHGSTQSCPCICLLVKCKTATALHPDRQQIQP